MHHTILTKTESGQHAFKTRSPQLAGKLRSAFLLFDGQRTVQQVLQATQGLGVTPEDVGALLQAGLLEDGALRAPELAPVAMPVVRADAQRYQAAYPVAVALTSRLGLGGFRLNLSVEGATSYEDLAALAPRIRAAVGEAAYAPLGEALFD